MATPLLTFLLLAIGLLLILRRSKVPRGLRRVPGPRGLPIVGHTFSLKQAPQQQLRSWANRYGELFQIQVGWYNWVFINSPAAVKAMLDKQSAVTSSRVPMPVGNDLISGGKRFLFMGYTPEWRKLRAVVHKLLTPKSSETFKPSQELESLQLLRDILYDNKKEDYSSFYMHVRRYTTSVVMTSTYGRRVPTWDCDDVRDVYGIMKEFSEHTAPGTYLADTIPPIADIIPRSLQWWRKSASLLYEHQLSLWMKYWKTLKQQIRQGSAPECFVRDFAATDYEDQGISEEQAAFVAGTMIEAGSETTSAALNSAIKYLAVFRDAQNTAADELNHVIGDDRLPGFADEEHLPYIRAMVKEILRIRPVTNIGTPHFTTEDIVYRDMHIPAGTVVSINQYAIHFDARHKDPESFMPDRFLDHPLKAAAYASHPDPYVRDHFGFGAGRRICPGMHLAENSLFITLARLIWMFDIRPCLNQQGVEEALDVSDDAYEPGSNTLPKPYRVRFVPRNSARNAVLLSQSNQL
ncbi:Fumitremorgin C synthase [Cyphellophora attinorum]|uniref:Fumitremorgin C synthase n=1 Tax=Cyphellophora attinorum TaxID=1664694 RepID=A0A0N0NM24_9EURO|nr:Fumitremorgin C synthase [Phialophora attinorum]KPI39709.1 Fumitremorgin C synthase [Phialophora attinorum]